jgi:hypothetical protein
MAFERECAEGCVEGMLKFLIFSAACHSVKTLYNDQFVISGVMAKNVC